MIKKLASIIPYLALVIACLSLYLQYNPKPEPPLKNITGYIDFNEDSFFNGKPSFIISIKNKGITTQKITSIQNDKGHRIHYFYNKDKEAWIALESHNKKSVLLDITPSVLKKLKNTNGLFVLNNIRNKKKIISKKDIQKALELYKKHIYIKPFS